MAPAARSFATYEVPDVILVRDDGRSVRLREELDPSSTIVLAFVYTGCTTVCPLTSATLAQLQDKLGADDANVRLVSISIDPDQDTPAVLHQYAAKFHAGPRWRHYTGAADASVEVQRAFDAYRGDKMNHDPDTFVRRAGSATWVRHAGFATADELYADCCGPQPVR